MNKRRGNRHLPIPTAYALVGGKTDYFHTLASYQ